MSMHVCVLLYTCTYVCVCMCFCVFVCLCVHVCTCTHVCMKCSALRTKDATIQSYFSVWIIVHVSLTLDSFDWILSVDSCQE